MDKLIQEMEGFLGYPEKDMEIDDNISNVSVKCREDITILGRETPRLIIHDTELMKEVMNNKQGDFQKSHL